METNHPFSFDIVSRRRVLTLTGCDLLAARERLAGGRPSFLLEHDGRQTLFLDPHEVLSIRDGALHIENEIGVTRLPGNPLQSLRARLETYRQAGNAGDAFASGAVGYLGYDCVQYLEKIRFHAEPSAEDEACFLVFRMAIISHPDHVVLVANGFGGEPNEGALNRAEIVLRVPMSAGAFAPRPRREPAQITPDDAAFTRAVREVKAHIRRGDIFQCVLSQRLEVALSEQPSTIYRRLRASGHAPYRYFFESPRQTLLGASPERLIRVQGNRVDTCPIAGTRPRGRTPAEDERLARQLRRSPKERAEHLMLVDLGRNDLGRVCRPGTVRVSSFRQLQKFSHVMHLVSTVEGELRSDETALGALYAAFPAGTLTGAPKIRAMEILARLEPRRRGAYGGAIVLYDFSGMLDSCITIRGLVARDGRAVVQAGAGLVADSRSARELAEIRHKSRAVRKALEAV